MLPLIGRHSLIVQFSLNRAPIVLLDPIISNCHGFVRGWSISEVRLLNILSEAGQLQLLLCVINKIRINLDLERLRGCPKDALKILRPHCENFMLKGRVGRRDRVIELQRTETIQQNKSKVKQMSGID